VLAYGGAPLGALLADHRAIRPDWLRPIVGALATVLLRPVDPVEHLPHLAGRFLLLGGRADRLIPHAAADRMRALTPDPKTVVLFTGDHLGVGLGQRALLERIIRTSTEWLIETGAVTPPTRSQGAASQVRADAELGISLKPCRSPEWATHSARCH
jgi:hypothetical protein